MQQDDDASSWNNMACDAHPPAVPAAEQEFEQADEHGEDITEACCIISVATMSPIGSLPEQ